MIPFFENVKTKEAKNRSFFTIGDLLFKSYVMLILTML